MMSKNKELRFFLKVESSGGYESFLAFVCEGQLGALPPAGVVYS